MNEPLLTLAADPEVAVRHAHPDALAVVGGPLLRPRGARGRARGSSSRPGATRPAGAGTRGRPEEPDPFRLCFERDLDRIKHSRPWRRLAGKCQVFVAPEDDHLRTRLTHAVEVAQVATGIARAANLCLPLVEAIALAHDCGHGPAGHASEDAFAPYLPGGYDHAVYGADVTLEPLNLCVQTLDGVRNHSWRRPPPATRRGRGRRVGRSHRVRLPRLRRRVPRRHPQPRRSPARSRRGRRHPAFGADRGIRPRGARRRSTAPVGSR